MRWTAGLKLILSMTCRDAAPRISLATDRKLPTTDRIAVGLHLSICHSCRQYRRQLLFLRRVLAFLRDHAPDPRVPPLPSPARSRIQAELARQAGSN